MRRIGLLILAALGIAWSLPARASVLVDSGVATGPYYEFYIYPTTDRFRLTFISDRDLYTATIVRSFGYVVWQWYDYTEFGGDFGWYRDNLHDFNVDCGHAYGVGGVCEDFIDWDTRELLSMSPLGGNGFSAFAMNPVPYEIEPQIGYDYVTYYGPLTTWIHADWLGGGQMNYRLYLTEAPEPATWALLIAGFGLAGAALRRRRIVSA